MKKVYYRGKPYEYTVTEVMGQKQYSLYENGVLIHFVHESDLDKRTLVSLILDSYYESMKRIIHPTLSHS